MRYLLLFMLLVGIFVVGKRSFHCNGFGIKGSGPLKTEQRSVTGFHALNLDLGGDVEIRTGDFNVEIQAQENLVPLIKTEVEDGRLRLYSDENLSSSQGIKFIISMPSFDALSVGGSGSIKCLMPVTSDKMNLDISGSGNISLPQGNFNRMDCSISGSGGLELGGKANVVDLNVSGSGSVDAKGFEINELSTDIAGAGSVEARVLQVLKANIAGSGSISYSGSPSVQSQVTGSGSINRVDGPDM